MHKGKPAMLPVFVRREKRRGGLRNEQNRDTLLKNAEKILFCVDEQGKKCYTFK